MDERRNRVAVIDFEASCLPEYGDSYPIEVALAEVGGTSRTWLIKPAWNWRYWAWSEEAEALHGISREMLCEQGVSPRRVLAELAEAARGLMVYTDSDLDAYWLETLCVACKAPLPFPLLYLGELFQDMATTTAAIDRAEHQAKARLPREHVACQDARRLALTVSLLSGTGQHASAA